MPVYLEVRHITTYRYARPVSFGTHRVLFRPRAAHDIRVLDARLEVDPGSQQRWIHDVFSNSVALVEPLAPAQALRFSAQFTIEHHGVKNRELPIAPEAKLYPFEYSPDDRIDLANFLPAQYPEDSAAVRAWVSRFLPSSGRIHTHDVLGNITDGVRNEFSYAAREAIGTQRPTQTLALRTGTCRDFALLMMEAARSLGLATRFVSGYIYDPALDTPAAAAAGAPPGGGVQSRDAGSGGTVGSGATHAWLHVFLPGAGWVPFDPTNTLYGGHDLIRVACTRTPEQAAPISGQWTGASSDFLGMEVEVQVRRLASAPAATAPAPESEASALADVPDG